MSVFGIQNGFKIVFALGLFPGHIFSISDSKFGRLGLQNRGFRMDLIATLDFSWKSLSMNFGDRFVFVFWRSWERPFWFAGFGNRLENETIFL